MMLAPIHSSILILGKPLSMTWDLGAEIVDSEQLAFETLLQNNVRALAVSAKLFDNYPKLMGFLNKIRSQHSNLQIAVSVESLSYENVQELYNLRLIDWIFENFEDEDLPSILQKAIEAYNQIEQQSQLFKLFDDQNERLNDLRNRLEERVEKRQKYLISSQKRLALANEKVELLHASLVAIHQAQSIRDIETYLFAALKDTFKIEFIKMAFLTQFDFDRRHEDEVKIIRFPILSENKQIGAFFIGRDVRQPFRPDEKEFFSQISEAVSLAVNRLNTLEQSEALKLQWEATFDAFSEPLCILSEDQTIIRTNRAMATYSQRAYDELIGKNPFDILFGEAAEELRIQPIPFRLTKETVIKDSEYVFEIICQNLTPSEPSGVHIVIFRDITEQSRLEKHALESSKMAELGTIGSSIAHELNNPLGGMINFLQLMKMDIRPSHPHFEDINEMEAAAYRCKEIVESLLGFARRSGEEDSDAFELTEAIQHALKLVEIQTKSKGIKINYTAPSWSFRINGHKNQIVQALRNILQNSIEAIDTKSEKTSSPFIGQIDLNISVNGKAIELEIKDNGIGIPKEIIPKLFNPLFSTKASGLASGLGLTVAFKIINEHNGSLEISSQVGQGTSAKMTMKSPELMERSQVFDGKI